MFRRKETSENKADFLTLLQENENENGVMGRHVHLRKRRTYNSFREELAYSNVISLKVLKLSKAFTKRKDVLSPAAGLNVLTHSIRFYQKRPKRSRLTK